MNGVQSAQVLFSVAIGLVFPRCLLTPDAEDPAVLDDAAGDVLVLGARHEAVPPIKLGHSYRPLPLNSLILNKTLNKCGFIRSSDYFLALRS